MAHEIEVVGGEAKMFFVGETPWHGLGKKLPSSPSLEEAITAAGLNWTVSLRKLLTMDGIRIPDKVATVRDLDGKILGIVGKNWRPMQNENAFKWFQPFLDTKQAELETAGSLRDGRRIWVLARLKAVETREIVPGDPVNMYVLLANGHDGSLAIHAGLTGIRVVCANTLAGSMGHKKSQILKVRHTKTSEDAMKVVQETIALANQRFEANVQQYKALARLGVTKDSLRKYINLVFQVDGKKSSAKTSEEKMTSQATGERLYQKIVPLFERGRGNDLPGVRGTMWGAYNAVSEFLAYNRGRTAASRMDSLWFGPAANINQRALEVATKIAA